MPLGEVGISVTYGEAGRLIRELGRETGSHLYADLVGMARAATHADIAAILHAEWYAEVHRDKKKQREPVVLPKPWDPPKPNADVTAERRAQLVEQLKRRSVFA